MRVKKTLLSIAWIILMIHAFVPHAHGTNVRDEMSWSETPTDLSAYDYVQIVLQFSPGPCHLDHFQNENEHSIGSVDFDSTISVIKVPEIATSLVLLFNNNAADDVIQIRDYIGSYPHRGPPQTS